MPVNTFSVILVLIYVLSIANALIEPSDLPQTLRECFEMKTKYSNVKEVPSEDICLTCVTHYLWKEGKHKHCAGYNNTRGSVDWIAKILVDIYPSPHKRFKRSFQRRRRREYRTLSDEEREKFHLALNKMKRDKVSYFVVRNGKKYISIGYE